MNSRIRDAALVLAIPLATIAAGQVSGPQSQHRMPEAPDRPVRLTTPLHHDALRLAVHLTAQLARVPLGVEMIDEAPLPNRVRPKRPTDEVLLNGLTVSEVLNAVVEQDGRYEWRESGGTIRLQPRGAPDDPKDFLNRGYKIVLQGVTLSSALTAIRRQVDPAFQPGETATIHTGPEPAADSQEEQTRQFDAVGEGTLRDILDSVVRAHGNAYWVVEYSGSSRTVANARISLCGFAGQCVTWSAP